MRGGLGDVHDGDVEHLLQAFATVLPEPGLDDGVVGLVVGEHAVQDRDGGQVALVVALHGVRADEGGELDDLGARGRDGARLVPDGRGHRLGGVDVDDEDAHGAQASTVVVGRVDGRYWRAPDHFFISR